MLFKPPLSTLPLKPIENGVLLYVKASPKASKDLIGKIEQGAFHPVLKIYIKSAASDGKANQALIELLSHILKIKKTSIFLESGQSIRLKNFIIKDVSLDFIITKLF